MLEGSSKAAKGHMKKYTAHVPVAVSIPQLIKKFLCFMHGQSKIFRIFYEPTSFKIKFFIDIALLKYKLFFFFCFLSQIRFYSKLVKADYNLAVTKNYCYRHYFWLTLKIGWFQVTTRLEEKSVSSSIPVSSHYGINLFQSSSSKFDVVSKTQKRQIQIYHEDAHYMSSYFL